MKYVLIKGNNNIFMYELVQRLNIFIESQYSCYVSKTIYEIKTLTNFRLLSFDTKEEVDKAYKIIWNTILAQRYNDVIVIDVDEIKEEVLRGEEEDASI